MKKCMLALGLILASSLAMAQAGDAEKSARKGPTVGMQEELGLTDEQKQKMREIRESGGTREEMQAVLTPEQQEKAKELRKDRAGKGAGGMKEKLGLSDEQAAKIKQIKSEGGSREEVRAVLTPEQQAIFDTHGKGK